jgi:hypothetical protein
MIDSSAWTGRRGGKRSLAVDFYRITPRWLWRVQINRDASVFKPFASIVVTAEALQDSP